MKLEKINCDTDNLRISIVFYMKKKNGLKNEYMFECLICKGLLYYYLYNYKYIVILLLYCYVMSNILHFVNTYLSQFKIK